MADPFSALYGEDPQAAQAAAQALAQAMARRKAAGVVSTIAGGPFAGYGKAAMDDAAGSADLLTRALQFRANRDLQKQRIDAYAPDQAALAADRAEKLRIEQQKIDLQNKKLSAVPPPKEPKPPDPAKRSLGEYLTPASADMTDSQRNDLLNLLAVPGAQWLDQMAELSAVLDAAGDAPNPDQIATIQRLIATALVKQNKVAGLGALSGEDINILKKAGGSVGELTNWLGQATGLRDLKASVRSAAQRGARDIELAAGTYGAKPVPGKPLDFSTFDARSAEYRKKWGGKPSAPAAGAKRPRRTVGGETREWDGTAWVPVKGE